MSLVHQLLFLLPASTFSCSWGGALGGGASGGLWPDVSAGGVRLKTTVEVSCGLRLRADEDLGLG